LEIKENSAVREENNFFYHENTKGQKREKDHENLSSFMIILLFCHCRKGKTNDR